MAERTEISFEVSPDEVAVLISFEVSPKEVAVLDGYCSAKNITRKTVIRQLLRDWSAEQIHVATLILRVAGNKPDAPGQSRSLSE